MNDLKQMLILARYQLRNYIRAKRLYILIIIAAVVISLIVYVNATFGNPAEQEVKDTASDFAGFAPTLVVLTALFFGGDAIASEYQNKTGYFLFPNPIRRVSIFWGKYIASFISSILIVLMYYLSGAVYVFYYHQTVPVEYYYSLAYSLIFLLSLLSLTYMFSTFFKSGAVAFAIVTFLYFLVFNIIDGLSQIAGIEPWFSITYAASIITLVFSGKYMGDYTHSQVIHAGRGITITIYQPYLWEGVAIMLAYLVIASLIGTIVFQKKEMK